MKQKLIFILGTLLFLTACNSSTPTANSGVIAHTIESGEVYVGYSLEARLFNSDLFSEGQGVNIAEVVIDENGSFRLELPSTLSLSLLETPDFFAQGCMGLEFAPADVFGAVVPGFALSDKQGNTVGGLFQGSSREAVRSLLSNGQPGKMVLHLFVDRDVKVTGNCVGKESYNADLTVSLNLKQGWNTITAEVGTEWNSVKFTQGSTDALDWFLLTN